MVYFRATPGGRATCYGSQEARRGRAASFPYRKGRLSTPSPSLSSSPNLGISFKIITDDTFHQHQGFDLASFEEKNWPPSDLPTFRVLKTESYQTFKSRVAHHFKYKESQLRLWVLVNRQNKTVRPDTPIPENKQNLSEPRVSSSSPQLF